MLLTSRFDDPLRPTLDIDFLACGDPAPDAMKALFAEIVAAPVEDDEVTFQPDDIRLETIREDVEYGGAGRGTVATCRRAETAYERSGVAGGRDILGVAPGGASFATAQGSAA